MFNLLVPSFRGYTYSPSCLPSEGSIVPNSAFSSVHPSVPSFRGSYLFLVVPSFRCLYFFPTMPSILFSSLCALLVEIQTIKSKMVGARTFWTPLDPVAPAVRRLHHTNCSTTKPSFVSSFIFQATTAAFYPSPRFPSTTSRLPRHRQGYKHEITGTRGGFVGGRVAFFPMEVTRKGGDPCHKAEHPLAGPLSDDFCAVTLSA